MTFSSQCDRVTRCSPSVTRNTHQTSPIGCYPVTHPLRGVTVVTPWGGFKNTPKNGSGVTQFLKGTK
jgi:hypothetical protein